MDEIHRAIAKGDMTLEQMLDRVPRLDSQFAAEIAEEARQGKEARIKQEADSLDLDIDDDGYLPDNTAFKVQRSQQSSRQAEELDMLRQTPERELKRKRRSLHGEGVNLPKRFDLGSLLLRD
jgi:hypothetical protein